MGNSRECQSIVDDNLVIDDVCAAFGQHVKYLVMESEPIVQVLSRCLAMHSQC